MDVEDDDGGWDDDGLWRSVGRDNVWCVYNDSFICLKLLSWPIPRIQGPHQPDIPVIYCSCLSDYVIYTVQFLSFLPSHPRHKISK